MLDGRRAGEGDVSLLVGTRKGGFIITSDGSRKEWTVTGPHWPGSEVFHMVHDPRDGGLLLAALNSPVWGPEIQLSRDMGATWRGPSQGPQFKEGKDTTVSRYWHLEPGREAEPGVAYAGVEPAALFKSADGGETWREVAGLTGHPSHPQWQPGLGGLCLHSIALDPSAGERMWVGMSAVGVFGTEDAGSSWRPLNSGVRADFLPDHMPEQGQCPHKLLAHGSAPTVLYQQNHCGVYRSDDLGRSWRDISQGLPSRFGFVLGLHPRDPDTVYVLPEDAVTGEEVGGGVRYVTGASFRVYRSRNGGQEWQPLTSGLPQERAYLHTMREGMATDHLDPCGVYVGTTTGQIFHSRDEGDTWELLMDYLPPINSLECAAA